MPWMRIFSEGDDGTGAGGDGGVSPPSESPSPTPAAPPTVIADNPFLSAIPIEYRETPWVQNILKSENPQEETWKQFANLQQTLGKRPGGMPHDDAPQEEWDRWAAAVAPKDISAYGDIKPQLPEDKAHLQPILEEGYPPELIVKVLESFRKYGVPKPAVKEAVGILNEFNISMAENLHQRILQEDGDKEEEFKKIFAEQFGPKYLDNEYKAGVEFVRQHVPPKLAPYLDRLPNEALAIISGLAYAAKQKYGKEDTIPSGNGAYVIEDVASLKQTMDKAMSEEAYRNPMHPSHEAQKRKVAELATRLAQRPDYWGKK